jgi:hypothetical protein
MMARNNFTQYLGGRPAFVAVSWILAQTAPEELPLRQLPSGGVIYMPEAWE